MFNGITKQMLKLTNLANPFQRLVVYKKRIAYLHFKNDDKGLVKYHIISRFFLFL